MPPLSVEEWTLSGSSRRVSTATEEANPIKSDPELQVLMKKLDTVKKYSSFVRWKDNFLNRLDEFLYDQGMEPATQACNDLEQKLIKLVKQVTKVLDFIFQGDLGEERKTVRSSLALNEMCNTLELVRNLIETLVPAVKADEREKGFSKFHLGAALIQQGFHQYVSMKAVEDATFTIHEKLLNVADRQQLELFDNYHKQVQRFCDVMADLNLYAVMAKCVEFSVPPPGEEDEGETIALTVETPKGETLEVVIAATDTLRAIKKEISKATSIETSVLVVKRKDNDKVLPSGKAAKDMGLKEGSELLASIFVEPKDPDPIIFVDVKYGTLFGVDRAVVIEKGILTPIERNPFVFDEAAVGPTGKERLLESMMDSPNLGVKPQIVVEKMQVEDYDLEEAQQVKSKWGVQLKKTRKSSRGADLIFVDVKTGAAGRVDRTLAEDKKFITPVGAGKDATLKEAEQDQQTYDKYVAHIRAIFGVKAAV